MAATQTTAVLSSPAMESVFKELNATPLGLGADEAGRRLKVYGENDPAPERRVAFIFQFFALFTNPILIILLVAGAVAGALGQRLEAVIIAAMVVLSALIDFVQSFRAQVGLERLKNEVAMEASVRRDGQWQVVPRRSVVPGDVVQLLAGNLVPADCVLISARDLHVQEAALTGESLPAEKNEIGTAARIGSSNLLYMGTSVVSGNATALVQKTGLNTEFGKIAVHLRKSPVVTDFEHGLHQFGNLILKTILFLVLFVFLATSIVHQATLEAFLFAVALAVGLTPEFLPMITTITLSQGALQMEKERVIVKRLAAIQNLGSIDILCSDKTGTLTTGEMSLEKHVDGYGNHAEEVYIFAYWNSLYQTGVATRVDRALHSAGMRTPLEDAILRHGGAKPGDCVKLDELPFDFERRRVSVVLRRRGECLLIAKGAPETILPLCTSIRLKGKDIPMDASARQACDAQFEQMGEQGLRVLSVAVRKAPEKPAYSASDESDLTFLGFLGFSDPPLPEASQTIGLLERDGISIKILTGDSEAVARHVCSLVGFSPVQVITGDRLAELIPSAWKPLVEETNVFARVTPAQKTQIIDVLRRSGHVVGFMGDGINDAPSLRAADVGISVQHAVDVARDAADVILLEPGLQVLHRAVREGRRAFVNVIKYLFMGTSSNFGNMLSMAAASIFLPFLPMTATQILVNNFLYDSSQLSIPTDRVDESMLARPRKWNISVLKKFMLGAGPISSIFDFLTFFMLLHYFRAAEAEFQTGWFVESLATQTLVLFVIRTAGNPFRSRPSPALASTIAAIVTFGVVLPFTPLAAYLGFVPLPASFLVFLALVSVAYLGAVQLAKKYLIGTYLQ